MRRLILAIIVFALPLSAEAQSYRFCEQFRECRQGTDQGFSHRVQWVRIRMPCIMVWSRPRFGSEDLCVFRRGQDVEVSTKQYGDGRVLWRWVPGLQGRGGTEFSGYIPEWRGGPVFE
jgi:hypothetical protein